MKWMSSFRKSLYQTLMNTGLLTALCWAGLCLSVTAQAQQRSGTGKAWLLSSSSEAKAAKRFSLQEWLENKDRRALMDMWLSINTPSPYEFMIGGSLLQYQQTGIVANVAQVELSRQSYEYETHAYAKFVGVTAQYQNNSDERFSDITGQFNLRLFGVSTQSTHITLHYGLRTRTGHDNSYRLNQQFPAATLQIYLMKYFGMYSHYRYFLPIKENFYGETTGDELTAGLFIEYGIIRVFGNFYQERQKSNLNSVDSLTDRKGSKMGLQFHF
jgi:hypothetical protein